MGAFHQKGLFRAKRPPPGRFRARKGMVFLRFFNGWRRVPPKRAKAQKVAFSREGIISGDFGENEGI